jgi:hypothetical protein
VDRRGFLVGLTAALVGCRALRYRPRVDPLDDHELATIAAIAETFVPGTPGAHDVDAVATIVDPAYGVAPYLGELVGDLDQWCLLAHHAPFTQLAPADRERALEERMGLRGPAIQSLYRPAYDGVLALAKLAFFMHPLGSAYAGFPGSSRGYAPASAAGAYAATTPTIQIAGAGNVSHLRVLAIATAGTRATLYTPSGSRHAIDSALPSGVSRAPARPGLAIDTAGTRHAVAASTVADTIVPARGPAAGDWRLVADTGRVALWSLILRTDLDDRA